MVVRFTAGDVNFLVPAITNRKDIHKVQLSRIMGYYVELQILDISIVS